MHRLLLLIKLLILCHLFNECSGHSSKRFPLAGIFGIGGGRKDDNQQQQQQQQQRQEQEQQQQRPPPPPPGSRQGNLPPPQQRQQPQPPQQYSRQPPPPRDGVPGRFVPPPPGNRPPPKNNPPVPPRELTRNQNSNQQRPPPPPPPPSTRDVATASQAETKEGEAVNDGDGQADDDKAVDSSIATADGTGEEISRTQSEEAPAGDDVQEPIEQEEDFRLASKEEISLDTNDDTPQQDFAPPPPSHWGMNTLESQTLQAQQAQTQGWMEQPRASQYGQWETPYYGGGMANDFEIQLEDSLARENELLAQLDNITTTIMVMEQREELHMRQLDVLTERVMDVEAQAAEDRNRLAESEANCTAMGMTLATLQDELEDWQRRCNEYTERHEEDKLKLAELERLIKEKEAEAEDLAVAMENLRLAERRREAGHSRRSQKNRGFFSLLLSWFKQDDSEDEDVSRQEAYDMAKSTLLRALQSERGNVHELESVVASLQQNNSAISEMVESRDTIIDELNNRIAVFEEDKVVLKAALRQLQKEIQEEAPKAQKLMDDLAKAEQEANKLKAEISGIIKTHQGELTALQQQIATKQKTISESESNLTAIGTYVDKLEDRLTSFAITRRDMEAREKKCKEVEEAAVVTEREKEALEVKVAEYKVQEEELKKLLEELAAERTTLQKESRRLLTEREFRIGEQEQLESKCASLESEVKSLTEQVVEWKAKCETLTPSLEIAVESNRELNAKLASLGDVGASIEEYKSKSDEMQSKYDESQDELQAMKDEKLRLETLLEEVRGSLREYQMKEQAVQEVATKNDGSHDETSRDVPLRTIRKTLSKATGIHGLITPSSSGGRTEINMGERLGLSKILNRSPGEGRSSNNSRSAPPRPSNQQLNPRRRPPPPMQEGTRDQPPPPMQKGPGGSLPPPPQRPAYSPRDSAEVEELIPSTEEPEVEEEKESTQFNDEDVPQKQGDDADADAELSVPPPPLPDPPMRQD